MSIDANTHAVGLDDVNHTVCCRPDWGLCGRRVTGWDFMQPDEPGNDCPHCAARMGRPCSAPFCQLRQMWRRVRGVQWSTEYEKRSKR